MRDRTLRREMLKVAMWNFFGVVLCVAFAVALGIALVFGIAFVVHALPRLSMGLILTLGAAGAVVVVVAAVFAIIGTGRDIYRSIELQAHDNLERRAARKNR